MQQLGDFADVEDVLAGELSAGRLGEHPPDITPNEQKVHYLCAVDAGRLLFVPAHDNDLAEGARAAFRRAQERWRSALETHRLAPPDPGFSARLAALSDAARVEAEACREAEGAGFEWPPHRAASSQPPYELRPESGRRGPDELWRHFDAAAADLSRAAAGTDLLAVADAYAQVGEAAGALAQAVKREDDASGTLQRRRVRGSA